MKQDCVYRYLCFSRTENVGLALLNQSTIDEEPNEYGYYYYYGSSERNRAMALETLLLLGKKEKHLLWQIN